MGSPFVVRSDPKCPFYDLKTVNGAIRSFILDSPVELLDFTITWAETFVRKKIEALKNAFPWRQ